jgi:hypothetical protein
MDQVALIGDSMEEKDDRSGLALEYVFHFCSKTVSDRHNRHPRKFHCFIVK